MTSAANRAKTAERLRSAVAILFAAWLAVLAVFLGTIVVRVRGARRWRREWRLIKDRGILALGERLSEKLGLFQPPVLFEADSCRSPVVFGAVRTSIVLPARLVAELDGRAVGVDPGPRDGPHSPLRSAGQLVFDAGFGAVLLSSVGLACGARIAIVARGGLR